ncbi:MAG: flagellar biosynthesis anti-sigma factor FlgM [Rubrivivax sp.]|nr:flagellar biosynthesis anti-sigma factor FlgM [Rubrivivax sp.]
MKIGPLDNKPPVAPAAPERKAVTSSMPAEASAQVALSPAASALSGVSSDPTFDTAKVERIAQAIRDGQFKVNAEAIADKLIVNAEELLGRKPS